MPYTFNPFTGKLDNTSAGGGGGGTPGGSDTQIQYNDGGSFGGATKLLYDDTASAEKLTLDSADLVLDDGGSFTTSVQAITATANRVVSFPDATGTVALVPGADTQIAFNNNGVLDGDADFTRDATSGITYTPTWNNGATTFGALSVDVTNTASAAASTLLDLAVGGTTQLSVSISNYFSQTPVTVTSLTAAATAGAGARAFVSDANATTFASIVAGSGSNNVPVYSDGTNWRIG